MGFQNQNNGQRPGNRGFNGASPMNTNNNAAGPVMMTGSIF